MLVIMAGLAGGAARADSLIEALDVLRAGNHARAAQLFRKAAREGSDDAFYMLGIMHQTGMGVKKSDSDAAILFNHIAIKGHARAQVKFGQLVFEGKGVQRNRVLGYMWLEVSALSGNIDARRPQLQIAIKMQQKDIDLARKKALACIASKFKNCK